MEPQIEKKIKAIDFYFGVCSKELDQDNQILLATDWISKFIKAEEYELAEFMKEKRALLHLPSYKAAPLANTGKTKKISFFEKIINYFRREIT